MLSRSVSVILYLNLRNLQSKTIERSTSYPILVIENRVHTIKQYFMYQKEMSSNWPNFFLDLLYDIIKSKDETKNTSSPN